MIKENILFGLMDCKMKKIIYFLILCSATIAQSQTDPWTNLFLEWNNTQGNSGTGVIRSI